jgi:predicted metal-binding membrane protein
MTLIPAKKFWSGSTPGSASMIVQRHAALWPWLVVAVAWGIYGGFIVSNNAYLIEDHTWLSWSLQARVSWWLVLVVFLATWCLMLAAMMTLPTVPMLRAVAWGQPTAWPRWSAQVAAVLFLCAFTLVWIVFGVLAFIADAALRWSMWQHSWTAGRPELITAGLLVIAGAYQLLPLKQKALHACHVAAQPATETVDVSVWQLGWQYGAVCLASQWALMLVMFGVGMTNLVWLVALSALLLLEHLTPWRHTIAALAGVALLLIALVSAVPLVHADTSSSSLAQGAPTMQTQHVGGLTVKLDPSTVTYGRHTIHVVVRDAVGAPIEGATVSARLSMIDMDMGTQVAPLTPSDAAHPGDYRGQLEMTMPGRWELTVVIHPPHAQTETSATFLITVVAATSG